MNDPSDTLERVEYLLELRRAGDAERLVRSVLNDDPGSARAMRLMSQALWGQERMTEALDAAFVAVSLDPNDVDGHLLCSHLLSSVGRIPEATAAAVETVRLAPQDWRTHFALGLARLRARGWPGKVGKSALHSAEEARQLAPHEPEVHNLIGDCYRHMGRNADARKAYAQAIGLDPSNEAGLAVLARMGLEQSSFREAGRLITSGLAAGPQNKHMQLTHDAVLLNPLAIIAFFLDLFGALIALSYAELTHTTRLGLVLGGLVASVVTLWWVARPLPQGWRSWGNLYRRTRRSIRLLMQATVVIAVLFLVVGVLPPSASDAGRVLAFTLCGVLPVAVLVVTVGGFVAMFRNLRGNS